MSQAEQEQKPLFDDIPAAFQAPEPTLVTGRNLTMRFARTLTNARMPTYGTNGAAAFDFYNADPFPTYLAAGESYTFNLGIVAEVPPGHVLLIFSRSSQGFVWDVSLANGTGVIDSDYRGDICVRLTKRADKIEYSLPINTVPLMFGVVTNNVVTNVTLAQNTVPSHMMINPGDRICQGIVLPYPKVELIEAPLSELTKTARGAGGFGSTGS